MGETAIIFPGQGSHTDGMRELVECHEPRLAALVLEELGEDPFARAAEATRFAQPAILCASLASWTAAGRPRGEFMAGHSLGELSALAAAGAIDASDAARLALVRGRLMDDAARRSPGGMLALFADDRTAAEVAEASGLIVANDNGPTQKVLAGPSDAIVSAQLVAKARGLRSLELAVAGPFHSPAIESAVEPFREALEGVEVRAPQVEVRAPQVAVLSSITVGPLGSPRAIRDALAAALIRPVRWRETMDELHARGVRRFLETGPGKALTGMVKRALDGVEASVLETEEAARA